MQQTDERRETMLREGHGYCDTCGERCDLNSIYRVGNTDLCVPCWG